ncbi:MAG: ribonuclease J [Firmicutes bacterium]|jgi:ribonuclease J|nr:ribonuclease J [Bacillota bacterium]
MKKKDVLKIIPLGGLNEIGKNMMAYQFNDEIIVVDCGLIFPSDELLGIDVVVPDITYLIKNQEKVKAVIITHGHEDHIGGLPYFLQKINVPIYATNFTIGLIENKLKEHKSLGKVQLNRVKPNDFIKIGRFGIDFIRVSHSIPDAVSIVLKTPHGTIIHTGDFKVDFTPIDNQRIDLNKFAKYGNQGVIALVGESTNAERKGYSMSESTVGATLDKLFANVESRIFVASFASNVHRVQQIVNAAVNHGRKVALSGRSMINVSNVALELGYLNIPEGMLIELDDIYRYPDNEVVVITTGSQGEPMSGLTRMARSDHRQVDIREGDLVILSSSPIPGNEKSVKKVIDLLYEKGATVIYDDLEDVHVSGHACQEELKLIHSLVKPRYFIPNHGEYSHLRQHAILAENMGMSKKNIFVLENGKTLEIYPNYAKVGKNVPSGNILIDGLGVGDVGNIVLRDRKHLSEDGLMVVVVSLSKTESKIVSGPDIISRGFVYVRESEELMKGAKEKVQEAIQKNLDNNVREWSVIKNSIRDSLNSYLYSQTKRNPMILPIIMES